MSKATARYPKVLVPLDGSALAEAALPYVIQLVSRVGPEAVVLLTIVEDGGDRTIRMAKGYLRNQAAVLEESWRQSHVPPPEVRVEAVRSPLWQVPATILRCAEDNDVSLIIMCTHGRSGVDRWLMGSVAEKVVRGADMPVLLIRNTSMALPAIPCFDHVLVPLDGSELAERALPHAQSLATNASSRLLLLHVRPPSDMGALAPVAPSAQDVSLYLTSIASGLKTAGVEAMTQVKTGHPSQQIVEEAEAGGADLIIMSSHGRTGLGRWAFGSVADQVLRASPVPVLLVRAALEGQVPQYLQGPFVLTCHNCGLRIHREPVVSHDQCIRCHFLLKACGNCANFDGAACLLQLPDSADTYPGDRCPKFQFRRTRLLLR